MAGLNGIAGALNAAAGFGKGLMQGQELKKQQALADEDRAFQMEQRGRIRQQYSDEDAARDALRKADEAGRTAYLSAINGQPAQPEQRQGAVDNYLTSGGTDGSMPDQSKLDGFDPATAPVTQAAQPAKPAMGQDQALLAGMTARARALAEHAKAAPGVSNEWLKTHNDAMTLRGQMRLSALDQAEAKWRATGDPSHMKDAYNLLDDGFTAEDITRTPDGKIRITRVNNKTGEKVTSDSSPEDFQKGVNFLRDPKATRQLEAKQALQDELQQWMLKRIAEQGLNQNRVQETRNVGKLDQIDAKGEIDERIARLRADASLKQAGMRIQGSMSVAQLRASRSGGSGGGAGGGSDKRIHSVQTMADGTVLAVTKSGDSFLLTDDNGNPRVSTKAVDQAMKIHEQTSKGLNAIGKTEEEVAAMAKKARENRIKTVEPPPRQNRPPIDSFGAPPPAKGLSQPQPGQPQRKPLEAFSGAK